MSTFFLFWWLSWLLGSAVGRLIVLALVLWYVDRHYLGLAAALWLPVVRAQRIAALRRTVELNPSDVNAMVDLGDHYLHGGNAPLAVRYLEQAAARGEDRARALFLFGAALVQVGRHEEGRARLEEALAKAQDVGFGEPHLYLLSEALATEGPTSDRVDSVVAQLDRFEGVEVLARAGGICARAGRKDLARQLYQEAVRNYEYIPVKMRRRHRRWLLLARWGLLQVGGGSA